MSSRISAELLSPSDPARPDPSGMAAVPAPISSAQLARTWAFRLGLLFAVVFWTVAWHWDTASSMAAVWWRSDTFAHGMLVYPISLWLVWRKRAQLAHIPCRPSYLAAILALLAGLGWLMGEQSGVQAAEHFGLVLSIALSVWAVLGTALARAVAFPLAFTLVAVPIGEFLFPILMEHTADFTVGALRLTGIPVYREANNFVIPSGHWSVVEACSGLRYLIASVMLGLLYAYLSYTSLLRRALFILASIAVPIVANWVRAYMIVMIGHLSGMKYAVGVDHLLYGWVFFGLVMVLLFWIGSLWREDAPQHRPDVGPKIPPAAASTLAPGLVVGALVVSAAVAVAPRYSEVLDAAKVPPSISLAVPQPANGWTALASHEPVFKPHYLGARRVVEQTYEKDGRSVGLFIAYYAVEQPGAELIVPGNGIIGRGDHSWPQVIRTRVPERLSDIEPAQAQLRSRTRAVTAWSWYWAGGRWVARPEMVKLLQARDRLLGRGDDAAAVVIFTSAPSDDHDAQKLLHDFYASMTPSIAAVLRDAARSSETLQSSLR